jgi:adenylate cyclase
VKVRRTRIGLQRSAAVLAIAVVTSLCIAEIRVIDPAFIVAVRERTLDAYQRYRPRDYNNPPVRVVDIDERSLALYGQWPWPRTRVAELTRRLVELGASVVCFDVLFAEPDRSSPQRFLSGVDYAETPEASQLRALVSRFPDHDEIFARVLAQSPSVLGFAAVPGTTKAWPPTRSGLAFTGTDPKTVLAPIQGAAASLPILNDAARGIGGISLNTAETGGVVRRIPMLFSNGSSVYPSLSVESLRVAIGADSVLVRSTGSSGEAETGDAAILGLRVGEFQVPLTSRGDLWLYFDRNRPERYLSAADVLDIARSGAIRPQVEGQVVFIGTSAVGLLDNRVSPLGEEIPGVAIHAQALEQILSGTFLSRPDWADGLEIVLTVVLGVGVALLLLMFGAQYSFVIGGIATAVTLLSAWLAFIYGGLLFDPVYPAASGLAVYLATTGILHIFTDRERRFVRQAFGQYLAPELLEQLEEKPDIMKLGGQVRELSIMFMDIRDFTPLSERLSAEELVHFLHQVFSPLTEAIYSELGTVDKYIGDSIMAFWNAPVAVPNHAEHACRAAIKMAEAVKQLTAEDAFGFRAKGYDEIDVKIGIGVNTGDACVGNMGSERRFNYSVVGDAVNTAARLESSCKAVGAELLISEPTAQQVPDFAMLEVGEVALKGKSRPAKVFALLGDEVYAKSPRFQELARHHAVLMGAIAAGSGEGAWTALNSCRSLAPDLQLYTPLELKLRALMSEAEVAKAS